MIFRARKEILLSSGYRGAGLKLLSRYSVGVGDSVEVATEEGELVGVLMPRYESASEDYIVIKLKSGYNTGIQVAKIKSITKLPKSEAAAAAAKAEKVSVESKQLPKVALISTGGPIAREVEYRIGGVAATAFCSDLD